MRSSGEFMLFAELVTAFLYSRKHGIKEAGAKCKASAQTLENYECQLKVFVDFMENERNKSKWGSLGREDIRAFIEHVNEEPEWSKSTKLTYLRTVRTLMNFIEKDEECADRKLKSWKKELPAIGENEARKNIPTPLQLKKWRAAFNTDTIFGYRNYVAFSLVITCGIRVGELSNLKMDWLKLDNREIFVDGKTGPRTVPITGECVRLLKGWLKRRDGLSWAKNSVYVFVGHYSERCEENGFGQVFRKMRKLNPDLVKLCPHLLRHSFGTYYIRNGGNLAKLQMVIGHANIKTTSKYLHLAEVGSEQIKEELEAVNPLKMLDGVRG
jgi:site-specific recombinase XerD